MEIASGIHQLKIPIPDNPLGYLNAYLIKGKDGWFMVDTGWNTPDAFETLVKELKDLGLSVTDVVAIVVTHVHPDHFGLAGRIKQLSPHTQLMMHHWEYVLIEPRYVKFADLRAKMGKFLRRHGVPPYPSLESASMPTLQFVTVTFPETVLYGGEVLQTGVYDLEVIWTPGHSPGHICLYEPQNKILFSGDHVLPVITSNINYHTQSGDNPLGDYLYALQKLRNLAVDKILPAHETIFGDLKGRIDQIVAHHEKRSREILQAIGRNRMNAFDISAVIPWDVRMPWDQFPPLLKRVAVGETIAHLEWMRWNGSVEKVLEGELVFYRSAGERRG